MNLRKDELPPVLNQKDKVAIDLELFQMEKRQLHRPTGFFACATFGIKNDVYLIEQENQIEEAVQRVLPAKWIMHNAQFDLFHLRRWTDVPERNGENLWDTMLWERMLWNGYYDSFSLEDLARRYMDMRMDKDVRKRFEKEDKMDEELRHYAGLDAWITYCVEQEQRDVLRTRFDADALERLWKEVEAPVLELVPKFKGMPINDTRWRQLANENERQKKEHKSKLDFNPASPQQVKAALKKRGISVPNTQASTLEELGDNKIAKHVLDYRSVAKLANTYGHRFLDRYLEDGRIISNYWTIGAETGRFSSSHPNIQNIPRDKTFRSCFEAGDGKKLLIADYAQQEARILASMADDQALLEIFSSDQDIYKMVASRIYGKDFDKITPEERFHGKTITLGLAYGLSAYGLSNRTELDYGESERLINRFFTQFKGVDNYIRHYRWLARRNEYVRTRYGRTTWINPHFYRSDNNAINAPIQGGAADQLKMALVMLDNDCKKVGVEYPVAAVIHDEIVAWVSEEDAVFYAGMIEDAMIAAGQKIYPEVEWVVDAAIADTWADKE